MSDPNGETFADMRKVLNNTQDYPGEPSCVQQQIDTDSPLRQISFEDACDMISEDLKPEKGPLGEIYLRSNYAFGLGGQLVLYSLNDDKVRYLIKQDQPQPCLEEEINKDIDLVVQATSCSREAAIDALEKNDGDIVNAIMDLLG